MLRRRFNAENEAFATSSGRKETDENDWESTAVTRRFQKIVILAKYLLDFLTINSNYFQNQYFFLLLKNPFLLQLVVDVR